MTAHSCTEFWCLLGSRSAGNVFNVARRHRASGFNHEASRRPNSMSGVLLFFLYSFVHGKIKGILRLKTFFRTPPHAGASVAGDERRRARRAASGEDRDQLKSSEYGKSFDLTVSGPFRSKVLESLADVAGRDFGPTIFRNGNDSKRKSLGRPRNSHLRNHDHFLFAENPIGILQVITELPASANLALERPKTSPL